MEFHEAVRRLDSWMGKGSLLRLVSHGDVRASLEWGLSLAHSLRSLKSKMPSVPQRNQQPTAAFFTMKNRETHGVLSQDLKGPSERGRAYHA